MLTIVAFKNARPAAKDHKLADSGGLHLYITKNGHKSWRFKYRFGGKEKRLIFGAFPEMSLAEAGDKRDEARKLVKDGKDPSMAAKRNKLVRSSPSAVTFEGFARAWHELQTANWKPVHAKDGRRSLNRKYLQRLDLIPVATQIGRQHLAE